MSTNHISTTTIHNYNTTSMRLIQCLSITIISLNHPTNHLCYFSKNIAHTRKIPPSIVILVFSLFRGVLHTTTQNRNKMCVIGSLARNEKISQAKNAVTITFTFARSHVFWVMMPWLNKREGVGAAVKADPPPPFPHKEKPVSSERWHKK